MITLKALFNFIKDKFDIDILWLLGIVSMIVYGIIATPI